MDIPNSKGRDGFWEACLACAEENWVTPDRLPFYVNWVKNFNNFLPEKSLKERTGKDIKVFLTDMGNRRGIVDWQVRQAEHALRILYEIFLPGYAPENHTRVPLVEKHPVQKATVKTDGFRDRVVLELLGHSNVITTMIHTHVLNKHGLSVKSPAEN